MTIGNSNTATSGSSCFSETPPELVAVILAATKGVRLYPMTFKSPKHALPVAGIELLVRLLERLQASGIHHIVVALSEDDTEITPELIKNHCKQSQPVQTVTLSSECDGSAEALRQIPQGLIHDQSHILVLPADLLFLDESIDVLQPLIEAHRASKHNACTVLFSDVGEVDEHGLPLKESAKQKKGGLSRDDQDIEYVALSYASPDATPRVVWKQARIDVEQDQDQTGAPPKLVLPKSRLRLGGCSTTCIRTDWNDLHLYILAPWVRKLVLHRTTSISIQGDLLPLLISRQFQGISATFSSKKGHMEDPALYQEALRLAVMAGSERRSDAAAEYSNHSNTDALNQSMRATGEVDNPSVSTDVGEYTVSAHVIDKALVMRANTIPAYLLACKEVVHRLSQNNDSSLRLPPGTTVRANAQSILLPETTVGAKANFKSSTVGRGCTLGAKCRLNNVVVLDHVKIGDNCVLQNSILGAGCTIGENCSLNDCQVPEGGTVEPGTKAKGVSFD